MHSILKGLNSVMKSNTYFNKFDMIPTTHCQTSTQFYPSPHPQMYRWSCCYLYHVLMKSWLYI